MSSPAHPRADGVTIGKTHIPSIVLLFLLLILGLTIYALSTSGRSGTGTTLSTVSLLEIQSCCRQMTEFQRDQYLATYAGKRVRWQGTVNEVDANGSIWMTVGSTTVEITDAPAAINARLRRDQPIDLEATISRVEQYLFTPKVKLRFQMLH